MSLPPDPREWALVLTAGARFVGRLTAAGATLSPVYELVPQHVILPPQGPGQLPQLRLAGYEARAVQGYDSLRSLTIPLAASVVIRLTDLAPADRDALLRGVEGLESMQRQARSGLLVVPGNAIPKG